MTFLCENCNYTTHRKHDWEKHRKTAKHQNNTIKQLVCNKCNKQLNSKTTFYRFMQNYKLYKIKKKRYKRKCYDW